MAKKKFKIQGKVKTVRREKSVGGLRVDAYIAGTRKKVGSTVTDDDGKYKIEFKYDGPVDISIFVSPNGEEKALRAIPRAKLKISKARFSASSKIEKANVHVPSSLWDSWEKICKTYSIYGWVVNGIPDPDNEGNYLDLISIPDVTVHIFDVSRRFFPYPIPFGSGTSTWSRKLGTARTDESGSFTFEFDWCFVESFPPWVMYSIYPFPPRDYKPDLLFKVTQTVNGVEVPLYEEDPESDTRWDVDQLPPLGVSLIVEGEVAMPDDPMEPIDRDFEFHGIGRVLASQINEEGYANTAGDRDVVKAKDSPFGSTIDIKGQFNSDLHGNYYQVVYAKWPDDDTAPGEADFSPILDEEWPVAVKDEADGDWRTVYQAPVELEGVGGGCYKIPDYSNLYRTSKDILVRLHTDMRDLGAPRYADGKYTLKVKVFNPGGGPVLEHHPENEIVVRLDNTWPVAKIMDRIVVKNGTTDDDPETCGIIYIESGKELKFRFDAYDEQDHFRNYILSYRTGHGVYQTIKSLADSDAGWNDFGFMNTDAHGSADWDITGLSQCGYEIRLDVWDRTTNGYRPIHRKVDFIHIVLLEP